MAVLTIEIDMNADGITDVKLSDLLRAINQSVSSVSTPHPIPVECKGKVIGRVFYRGGFLVMSQALASYQRSLED